MTLFRMEIIVHFRYKQSSSPPPQTALRRCGRRQFCSVPEQYHKVYFLGIANL